MNILETILIGLWVTKEFVNESRLIILLLLQILTVDECFNGGKSFLNNIRQY